jgi:hypothetical protein
MAALRCATTPPLDLANPRGIRQPSTTQAIQLHKTIAVKCTTSYLPLKVHGAIP